MPKTFVLTDESLNNYGFWLPTSGAVLDQFKKNPIMLWMHNRAWRGTKDEILPIGYWDNVRIEGGKILADAVFDDNDDFAASIGDKVENNVLRMASCGIKVVEKSKDPKWLKPGQTCETPTKWVLREASIVDIGSNDNALSLAFYDDNDELINLADAAKMPLKKLLNDDTNTNSIHMKKIAKLLGLAEDSNEDQLVQTIQQLNDKVSAAENAKTAAETQLADYQKRETDARKAEARQLLDSAIADGRLNAEMRPSWESLFDKDHESTKLALTAIPKRASVKEALAGSDPKNVSERERLAKLSWDELDKQGDLRTLKEKYEDLYEEKFEQKFNKKPDKK